MDLIGHVALPPHVKAGGFDHAAVHPGLDRLYVAHTANDALDVVDCATQRYLHSVEGLTGVAGVLVDEARDLVVTSNRGEDTVALFSSIQDRAIEKVAVGIRPNGLAVDSHRGLLLVANVGRPEDPATFTMSVVDLTRKTVLAQIPVSGRTRWAIADPDAAAFYVNIAEPPQIVVVDARQPDHVARSIPIAVAGPHGLDFDHDRGHLFCTCDGGALVVVEAKSGAVVGRVDLSGVPDVVFFDPARHHLYVAIGDPGVIDVVDTEAMRRVGSVVTEPGAHTIAFHPTRHFVYTFLPHTHRAAIYRDTPSE